MEAGRLKAVSGLVAVVVAIVAVAVLTIFTLTRLDTTSQDSMVAITTSAFGIISAVVSAYLGIKISAETIAKATDQVREAAIAEHETSVALQTLSAVTSKVEDVMPEKAAEIKEVADEAAQKARTTYSRHHRI